MCVANPSISLIASGREQENSTRPNTEFGIENNPGTLDSGCWPNLLLAIMTSSNGNIFRVTGPLCGEFTGHRWIPLTKASDAELDVFFDLGLNKRSSKQSKRWWFETPSCSLWRHRNGHKGFFATLEVEFVLFSLNFSNALWIDLFIFHRGYIFQCVIFIIKKSLQTI